MARLARITVYPVKSLDGLDVAEARVLPAGGLQFDRQFALHDRTGKLITAKRNPGIHAVRAAFDLAARRLTLRCGQQEDIFSIDHERGRIDGWFTAVLGMDCSLKEDADWGFPDDTQYPGPTVTSTSSLREVASWFPGLSLDEVRRRFRANLEIDDVPPFWEDSLFTASGGVSVQIGEVTLRGMNPCLRCPVPARNPETGEELPLFAKTFVARRQQSLPPWAARERFEGYYRLSTNTQLVGPANGGRLRIGDRVSVNA